MEIIKRSVVAGGRREGKTNRQSTKKFQGS